MNQLIKVLIYAVFGLLPIVSSAKPLCTEEALKRAEALLSFHLDGEDGSVAQDVTVLAPIKNPENPKQQLRVLEVWGFFYKGKYRMRFVFSPASVGCTLLGEEILQYAKL